jgi:hypothetical protein
MKTHNDYEPETTSLLNRLIAAGFTIDRGGNGGEPDEDFKFTGGLKAFVEELTASDEGHLYLKSPGTGKEIWIHLVFGNEPGVLPANHTIPMNNDAANQLLDEVRDAHYAEWADKKQPAKEVE